MVKIKVKSNQTSLKFIDLFCGVGGFHQALSSLGHECVLASDIDKACQEVYKDNYNIEPVSNIKDIVNQSRPSIPVFDAYISVINMITK